MTSLPIGKILVRLVALTGAIEEHKNSTSADRYLLVRNLFVEYATAANMDRASTYKVASLRVALLEAQKNQEKKTNIIGTELVQQVTNHLLFEQDKLIKKKDLFVELPTASHATRLQDKIFLLHYRSSHDTAYATGLFLTFNLPDKRLGFLMTFPLNSKADTAPSVSGEIFGTAYETRSEYIFFGSHEPMGDVNYRRSRFMFLAKDTLDSLVLTGMIHTTDKLNASLMINLCCVLEEVNDINVDIMTKGTRRRDSRFIEAVEYINHRADRLLCLAQRSFSNKETLINIDTMLSSRMREITKLRDLSDLPFMSSNQRYRETVELALQNFPGELGPINSHSDIHSLNTRVRHDEFDTFMK